MHALLRQVTSPALAAGLVMSGAAAQADNSIITTPRIAALTAGLFCAPAESGRRAAPDTMVGWVHEPDTPVEMIAEGQILPAVIGLGFGVRFTLSDSGGADLRYTVTHPPIPPSGTTSQSWDGHLTAGFVGTAFFQFDYPHELQPGDWRFSVTSGGDLVFDVGFTVHPAADLPQLANLCRGGDLLSLSQTSRAAAG